MPLIDADVHNAFADVRGELRPFLPRLWQDFADRHGVAVPPAGYVSPVGVQREDARPPSGGIAGSDPDHLIRDHLDRHGVDYAILTGSHVLGVSTHFDPDWGNALATAYNMNLAARWLGRSDRFRGSIVINHSDPEYAAAEIRRCAPDRRFVQVLMGAGLQPALRAEVLPPDLRGRRRSRPAGGDPPRDGGRGDGRHAHPGRAADAVLRVAQHRPDQRHGPRQLARLRGRLREVPQAQVRRHRVRHRVAAPPHVEDGQELQGAAFAGAVAQTPAERVHQGPRPPDHPADRGAGEPQTPPPDIRNDRRAWDDPLLERLPSLGLRQPEGRAPRAARRVEGADILAQRGRALRAVDCVTSGR